MRTGMLYVVLLVALAPGCMHYKARVNQQLLERELRLQEDCIYRLKWQLEDCQNELAAARQDLEAAKKEADTLRENAGGAVPDVPAGILGPSETPRGAPRLPPAPVIQPGVESPPGGIGPLPPEATFPPGASVPPQSAESLAKQSPAMPAQPDISRPTQATLVEPANPLRRIDKPLDPDADVAKVLIDPASTGGLNGDGKPGDEMLSVAIEQRDPNDRRVLAPGDVSIVVIDPALDGRKARIARWNFEADTVAEHVRRSRDGGALHFNLPWPKPPQHRDLQLFVRFTNYEGRRLEANMPIEVQLVDHPNRNRGLTAGALVDHEEDVAADDSATDVDSTDSGSIYEPDADNDQPDADDESDNKNPPSTAVKERPKWSPHR